MVVTKVKLNLAGFRELRNSVVGDLADRAARIADACGSGYESAAETGRNRARAAVWTASPAAIRDNARNNTIVRNLGAGK